MSCLKYFYGFSSFRIHHSLLLAPWPPEHVGTVLEGEIFPFLVGYSFDPEVEDYIRKNYPQTRMFKSYEFELKYKRSVLQ